MTAKRIPVLLVVFCTLMGVAVGGVASMPAVAPGVPITVAGSAVAATDVPVAATGGSAATTNDPTGQVSDCDLIDIDGNDNTVSVNISDNATADGDGVSIQYHCRANSATTIDHDLIDIDGHNNSVTLVVRVEAGAIVFGENGNIAGNNGLYVALNCEGGTLTDCDAVDIDGNNNSVILVMRSDDGQTVHEFGASSEESVSYYQIDFVVGEPIENLRGPEGYYTLNRLIRFAHGSTDTPVMRRSDGEFLASGKRARCIESQNISVENGTAKTMFTVKEGCDPVTLTLASYEKVGPGWSPETEAKQEFVDAETHTFGPGTYTLSVDLPDEETNVTIPVQDQPDDHLAKDIL